MHAASRPGPPYSAARAVPSPGISGSAHPPLPPDKRLLLLQLAVGHTRAGWAAPRTTQPRAPALVHSGNPTAKATARSPCLVLNSETGQEAETWGVLIP